MIRAHKPANSRTRRKKDPLAHALVRTDPDATHTATTPDRTPRDTTHRSRRRQPHAAPPRDARSASERRHEVGLRHLDRVLGVLRRAQRLDALERRLAPNRGELRAREADQLRVTPAVAGHLAHDVHAKHERRHVLPEGGHAAHLRVGAPPTTEHARRRLAVAYCHHR